MKKKLIVAILCLLLTLSVSMFAVSNASAASTGKLKFDVFPYGAMEITEAEEYSSFAGDPTSFNIDMIDVENVANDGSGVYVAVLDTGIAPHWKTYWAGQPLFQLDQIKEEWGIGFTHDVWWNPAIGDFEFGPLKTRNFYTGTYGSGHGTHVTSIITGYNFRNLFWVKGVAPKAKIIPVLVLDAWVVNTPSGPVLLTGGTEEMVSAGIRYIADLAKSKGIKIVINMSLGGPSPSAMIEDAIDYAIKAGVIVVVAAGNRGEVQMDYPGAYPQVISASAGGWTLEYIGSGTSTPPTPYRWWLSDVPEDLNTKDILGNNWQTYLTDFSSRPNRDLGQTWKNLDVCCVGAAVVGPYKPYGIAAWSYYTVWGTSQATPHVAGIAALILQSKPKFKQSSMEEILKYAATLIPMPSDGALVYDVFSGTFVHYTWNDHDYGSGFLQADNALYVANL